MMDSKVTYKQQVSFCGKPQCRKCRDGIGHGPYWYAYHTSEQGRTVRTYIGKRLPAGVQGVQGSPVAVTADVHDKDVVERQKADPLLALADERIAQAAFATAIEPLDRLIAINPTNEAAVQRLIFVLARLKRRGEAIRTYQKFAATLQNLRNTSPTIETRTLFESIQQGIEPLMMPVGTDLSSPPRGSHHLKGAITEANAILQARLDKSVPTGIQNGRDPRGGLDKSVPTGISRNVHGAKSPETIGGTRDGTGNNTRICLFNGGCYKRR